MKPARNDSIIIVIIIIAVVAFFIGKNVGGKGDHAQTEMVDSLIPTQSHANYERGDASRAHIYYNVEGKKAERFFFDPNTADSTQLLRLGLRQWQVRNIYKYRAKGGRYRKPEDFARLYGLSVGEYKSLEPYIKISPDYQPASSLLPENEVAAAAKDTLKRPIKLSVGEHIALNSADTTLLKRVPGIGSGYARAIVNYRNRLGGYANVRQLLEIDGLPEDALQYMSLPNADVKRLNVNHLTLDQLKKHPYLNFYQARSITERRRLHGPLRSISDLQQLPEFTEKDIERLSPYLQF